MAGIPPIGVRPPMMFGPLPPGFPPRGFQPIPRLPFDAPPDKTGEEGEAAEADAETGDSGGDGDNNAEESLHEEGDDVAASGIPPFPGNFPRPPMGCGDWHMRGPVPPFMGGPNMPRPDLLRGPPPQRPLLGDSPRPRSLLRAPPRFNLPSDNFAPNLDEEEEGEEYCDEYEEEEGNEEEEYNENYGEEEEEEYENYDGNDCLFLLFIGINFNWSPYTQLLT